MSNRKKLSRIVIIIWLVMLLPAAALAIEQKQGAAINLKTKGDACYSAGRYFQALEYYTQALHEAKDEQDDHMYNACLGNIGNIYGGMNDMKRALHYYTLGYEASVKSRDVEMQWRFATNIVAAYCILKDVANAKVFFNLQMSIPIKDVGMRKYYFLNNQASIAASENNSSMAEYYFKATIAFASERHMPAQYIICPTIELGKLRMALHDLPGAMTYFVQARDSMSQVGHKDQLVNIYKAMADIYKTQGHKDSAQKYRSLYLSLSDSIFNISQFNVANSKLFEYENTENKRHIDSLILQNHTQMAVIVVFIILTIIITYLYIALRKKTHTLQDAQRMLVSKNEELMQSDSKSKLLLKRYVEAINQKATAHKATDTDQQTAASGLHTTESAKEKEERNNIGLTEEQRNRLLDSITTILEDVDIISRSDFNLNMLADMAGSNTKYVSWIINDTYGKNFKTLLNEYRIREACKRLSDQQHYGNMTIQAIYEELGYNSAASFIQAFKKVNGMTPSVYQKVKRENEPHA